MTSPNKVAAGAHSELPLAGMLHLLVIYVIWGSTYLAIRVAVREGSGFPPFTMGALRTLIGGSILLGLAALRHPRRSPPPLLIFALLIGLAGIGVLSAPHLAGGDARDLAALAALLLAPFCWALGSVLQRRRPGGE